MKAILPYVPTLMYTNVPENTEPQWSGSTTYALGARVRVTPETLNLTENTILAEDTILAWPFNGETPHKVYESLRAGNTNRYPKDHLKPQQESATSTTSHEVLLGSKTFTVQSGKGFSPGAVVQIAKSVTPRTVNMTAEIISYSGTSLVVSVYSKTGEGTHNAWTITTEDEVGWWKEVGATNQYLFLDEYVNTQTTNPELIHVKLQADKVDHVAMFGLAGKEVHFTLWNADETVAMWSTVVSLVYGTAGVQSSSWSEYFFGAFRPKTDCDISIPFVAANAVLEIKIIAAPGVNAAIGTILVGRAHDIGIATYGMSAGMLDYSTRETDEQGRTKLEPGPWAKRCELDLRLPRSRVDGVHRVLSGLRATPTAYIGVPGVDGYDSFNVFGTVEVFDVTVVGNRSAWCRLEIVGLI